LSILTQNPIVDFKSKVFVVWCKLLWTTFKCQFDRSAPGFFCTVSVQSGSAVGQRGRKFKIKEEIRTSAAVGNENDQKPQPNMRRVMHIALGAAALNQTCSQRETTAAERVKYSLHPSSRAHIWTSSLLFFSFPPSCHGKSQN